MKTNGNEMAYPLQEMGQNGESSVSFGLTKREIFAAMALQGMLADGTSESHLSDYAIRAVRAADNLIEALNK